MDGLGGGSARGWRMGVERAGLAGNGSGAGQGSGLRGSVQQFGGVGAGGGGLCFADAEAGGF